MSTVKTNAIEPASGGTVTITGAALTTPALGTPASGTLTNCTGLPASAVVNTPAGGISATTVQAALDELDADKFDKSGGTITGMTAFGAGFKLTGAATLGASAAKEWSYEHPVTRYYFGDGSGYSFALAKRVSSTTTDLLTLTDAGNLAVSGNLLAGTNTGSHHTFEKNNASNYATSTINSSATTPYGHRILLSGVTGGAGGYFISCQDNAARFQVLGNGNVENVNNSYGAISDAKLKRDVTDTGPKLSKVLAMRIVNYYLKADPTNTKLLGMIAQELREISPGLVEETPDFEDVIVEPARTDTVPLQRHKTEARTVTKWDVELRDGVAVRVPVEVTEHVPLFIELPLVGEDGQPIMDVVNGKQVPAMFRQPVMEDYTEAVDVPAKIERRATGTVTLSIKYSILVPMLVKAMQELHADFDGRLRALEA